jgi:hypothetical protein
VLVCGQGVRAADVVKAASGTDLTNGVSWGGSVPTAADTATWESSSLGAGLTLGNTVLTGTYQCEIDGATADLLAVGTLDLTGATLVLTELFMGESGSGFTPPPALDANDTVSFTKGGSYTGVYGTDYVVQTSPNLGSWTNVLETDPNLSDDSPLEYTLAPGGGKSFVRLKVMGPQ